MPLRRLTFQNNYYYHVFNRGLDKRVTFTTLKEFKRAQLALWYYRYESSHIRLSHYLRLNTQSKSKLSSSQNFKIEILAYCFLPNHFHFLVKQLIDGGVSQFMSQFENSYTKYYNEVHKRKGNLFQIQFKAVPIQTDEQLLHVSRYIHLNPYTHSIVGKLNQLASYPWSSFPMYLGRKTDLDICKLDTIMSSFNNKKNYKQFVYDQAEYQKQLDIIKHLAIDL